MALEGSTGNAAVLDLHCLDNSGAGTAPPSLQEEMWAWMHATRK